MNDFSNQEAPVAREPLKQTQVHKANKAPLEI